MEEHKKIIILLTVIFPISFLVGEFGTYLYYGVFMDNILPLIKSLSLTFLTGGIIFGITSYIPDRIRRNNAKKLMIEELKPALKRHIEFFCHIYKSDCRKDEVDAKTFSYKNMLKSEKLTKAYEKLIIDNKSPLHEYNWGQYIVFEFRVFEERVDKLLSKFSLLFGEDIIDALLKINSSVAIRSCRSESRIWAYVGTEKVSKYYKNVSITDHLDIEPIAIRNVLIYIELLQKLCDVVDSGSEIEIDKKIWKEDTLPYYRRV